jgi:hypothetical protein
MAIAQREHRAIKLRDYTQEMSETLGKLGRRINTGLWIANFTWLPYSCGENQI